MKQAIETRTQAYKRITEGIRSFVNHSVGAAKLVLEAKRTEIWREKWSSWQEYCEKEFGKTRMRVHQLLEVASTIDEIENVNPVYIESGKNKEILNEITFRQAKELKGLPPDKKAEVFHKAIAVSGGKSPRPETIANVRRSSFDADPIPRNNSNAYISGNSPDKPEIRLDKVGRPIPNEIQQNWDRAHDLGTRFRSMVSEIKCSLQDGIEKDNIFCEVRNGVISEAAALFASLEQLVPYSVCHACQGQTPESCDFCNHRGFYSHFMFKGPSVGEKFRKIMQAIANQYAS